jgi:hypothetical protein
MVAGLVDAALFYGDGVITPAISVLSAVEDLKGATPLLNPYVIPISLALLIGLFLMQSLGHSRCRTPILPGHAGLVHRISPARHVGSNRDLSGDRFSPTSAVDKASFTFPLRGGDSSSLEFLSPTQ